MKQIHYLGEPEFQPVQHYPGDAGFDLFVSSDRWVMPNQFMDVPCGLEIELPVGVWAMITGRSSTLKKRKLLVVQGIIDNGYRGPLFFGVQNLSEQGVLIQKGERLAQLIPFEQTSARIEFVKTNKLLASERGEKSFGSTGR